MSGEQLTRHRQKIEGSVEEQLIFDLTRDLQYKVQRHNITIQRRMRRDSYEPRYWALWQLYRDDPVTTHLLGQCRYFIDHLAEVRSLRRLNAFGIFSFVLCTTTARDGWKLHARRGACIFLGPEKPVARQPLSATNAMTGLDTWNCTLVPDSLHLHRVADVPRASRASLSNLLNFIWKSTINTPKKSISASKRRPRMSEACVPADISGS